MAKFRAIFRLIFEQVRSTVDNASNLRDLVLQELNKIIVVCYTKNPLKDESEDGPKIGRKHVAGILT